jgi:hypothetical protein
MLALTATALATAVTLAIAPPRLPARPAALSAWRHAPRVSLWTDRETPYRPGEPVRVYLSVREPSFLTVLRIDTDGGVRALFPRDPWADAWVDGGHATELAGASGRGSFIVDDYPGLGYLFVVASPTPIDFGPLVRRDQWDYHELAGGRLRGDPYVALTSLAEALVPDGVYDYDVVPYYVGRRYDYPRFVCYDCHTAATASAWDPYGESCPRYRIVIYDDPYYYPYRASGGRAVVTERPARPGPRYVFRAAQGPDDFVSRAHRSSDAGSSISDHDRSTATAAPARRRNAPPAAPSTGEPELRRRDAEQRRRPNP